jgi:hypothetical protein
MINFLAASIAEGEVILLKIITHPQTLDVSCEVAGKF